MEEKASAYLSVLPADLLLMTPREFDNAMNGAIERHKNERRRMAEQAIMIQRVMSGNRVTFEELTGECETPSVQRDVFKSGADKRAELEALDDEMKGG